MIPHYEDPYKVKIDKIWETQKPYLIAGQIKNYFYLKELTLPADQCRILSDISNIQIAESTNFKSRNSTGR